MGEKDSVVKPRLTDALVRMGACGEARDWVASEIERGSSIADMWDRCPRGDWLLWLAGNAGVERKRLVLAACACARLALPYTTDPRVLRCIETTEAWTRGDATIEQVRAEQVRAEAADMHGRCAGAVRATLTRREVEEAIVRRMQG